MDQDGADGTDPNFAVTSVVTGEGVVVTVTGEVDMSTAGDMRTAVSSMPAERPAAAVTLDLRAVTFFDSAAIHALLQIAERYGAGLKVLPSPQVRRVLEISGLATQPWLVTG